MSDWLSQSTYFLMLMQVAVTLILVPVLSYSKLTNIALNYGVNRYPQSESDVKQCLQKASKYYWSTVVLILVMAGAMVIHAISNGTELLNWDNQMGVMIMYILAMIPVVVMVFMHKRLFTVFKQHAGSKRSASLRVRRWQDYIPKSLLALIGIANLVFIATVIYFVNHPFDGFAGYTNLLGLIVMNVIFFAIIIYIYNGEKNQGYYHPEHRDAIKKRAIHINMLILALALLHISLTIWVQGNLAEYKLIVQSLYLQVILALSAFALTLPKSVFDEPSEGATL
jgi:MFS family permease